MEKRLLKTEAGVRLEYVDAPRERSGTGGPHWRLTTLRPNQPRVFADGGEAEAAYLIEVEASWRDPIVRRLFEKPDDK